MGDVSDDLPQAASPAATALASRLRLLETEASQLRIQLAQAASSSSQGGSAVGDEEAKEPPAALPPQVRSLAPSPSRLLVRTASKAWQVGAGLAQQGETIGGADGGLAAGSFSRPFLSRRSSFITPKMWKPPIRVAVTGASGQIANHLLFKIAAGE